MDSARLNDNERRALKKLRDALQEKITILDIRLFGSRARGQGDEDSDLDVMIEIPEYDAALVAWIDDIVFGINLDHDVFICPTVFGRDELEEGPMSEAPIYKAICREGISL